MGIAYRLTCLICAHIWTAEDEAESCPVCGEFDDVELEEID